MQKFKTLAALRLLIGGVVLVLGMAWPLMGAAQDKTDKPKDPDPQAQPKDKQPAGDQTLASQIAELHAKVEKLEAALKQNQKGTPSGTLDKGGLEGKQDKTGGTPPGGRVSAKFQNCIQCHQTRPSGPLPPSHLEMAGGSDKGAKQDEKTGTGDNKTPADGKAGMGGKGMGMMGGKGMGMMGGKGMGMGMMEEKKAAGMGKMDEKKGMPGMGGGKTGTGGSTTGTMDQQKIKMLELRMQMLELKMEMLEKGAGTDQTAPETDPDPHAGHTGTPPATPDEGAKVGVQDKTPDPGKLTDTSVDTGKDLPAQVRELRARIANLEAALKTRP